MRSFEENEFTGGAQLGVQCRIGIAALLMGLCLQAAAAEGTLKKIHDSGVLKIGFRPTAVPFSYLLPDSLTPVGYAIDICTRVAQALQAELKLAKLNVEFVLADNQDRFDALKQNRTDLECGNTTNSRERREKLGFAFSIPYFVTGTRLLVRKDSGIRDTPDLRDRTVVVAKGATGTKQIQSESETRSLRIKFAEVTQRVKGFEMLETRKADAFAQDDIVLYNVRATAAKPAEYSIVGSYLSIEPLAIMFRGEDLELKKVADREISRMIESGDFKRTYAKWFERPIPPRDMNFDMPMNFLMRDLLRFPTDQVSMFPDY